MANNTEIRYNGYAVIPSDYDCPDGQLTESLNLIYENGQINPIPKPVIIKQFPKSEAKSIVFIHKTNSFAHYIFFDKSNGSFLWSDASSINTETGSDATDDDYAVPIDDTIIEPEEFSHINAIGNTLIIFCKFETIYIFWQNDSYTNLGNHIPEIDLSFGLIGKARFYSLSDESKKTFKVTFAEGIPEDELKNKLSEDNQIKITEQIMAKVNKFLREQTIDKGRFALPFFVRYAYRLYDGSLTMHSAPVLMLPSTGTAPLVLWDRVKGKSGKYTEADIDIMLVSASLDYRPYVDYNNSSDYKALLEKWGDIVKSVDIFISKPIYMWNPDGKIDSFYDSDNFDTKFIGRLFCKGTSTILIPSVKEDYAISRFEIGDRGHTSNTKEAFDNLYLEWSYKQIYALFKNPERTYPATTIHLPEHTEEKIRETIENTSTFYKLHSIQISDLPPADSSIMNIEGERKEISVADDYLQSLVSREVMTDDYLSHDNLAADYSVNFNSRLNLSGVKRKLFNGFPLSSMFCYRNRMTSEYNSGASDSATFKFTLITDTFSLNDTFVEIFIKENGNNYRVMSSSVTTPFLSSVNILAQSKIKTSWGTYLFYPNVNAFKLVIRDAIGEYVIDLKPHDFLNGAYALLDFETVRDNMDYPEININQDDDNWIDVHNKIYTSEVNNPFLFPLLGINTVGTGKILAIATAAKALSQGQFGQFPLYAFTTEGVWALEINSSGNFTARQPITRDVCTNIDAITQLDSEVLFITDRGIILISGSNTTCISDIINTEFPFDISTLPGISQLHRLTAPDLYPDNYLDIIPFSEFVKGCGMLYDYVHQRVIVYNPDTSYAYVFSLNSKSWGMMNLNIQSGINSYPDALAIDKDNNLVSFSIHSQVKRKGLYITRPFKLGDGNTLKTIDSVIQRGSFAKGNVTTVLYGSRDLINWHLVWTSKDHFLRGFRGSPYKYFRIAGITDLNFMESLSGASIQFTPRLTNQPR